MNLHKKLFVFSVAALLFAVFTPTTASAQREVHWQINPSGFPNEVSVFADVEDRGSFRRDLTADAFAISVDEFAAKQGGTITNAQTVGNQSTAAGWAGAQVLIMIDVSQSYTKEFKNAKKVAKSIVNYLDPTRDQVAIATFPAQGGYSESKLDMVFSNNKDQLKSAIQNIKLFSDDEKGARICNALTEGLTYFPETVKDKYRVIIFLSGGADKGEGKGSCVKDSYAKGLIPFYNVVFKLDRKFDDKRNSHKIENGCYDLAVNTGGRSIFRRSASENAQFASILWNRIRSQYRLQVYFPCFKPAPYVEHTSVLKVENRDWSGIKFKATSTAAPVPTVSALYPPQAYRNHVDDGKIELTIDGSGFCGGPGQIKAYVGGRPVSLKSQSPYRLVANLNSNIDTGSIKIVNRFGQNGESEMKFKIIKPPKGAEASGAMLGMVIAVVALVLLAIIIIAIRSRKAKVPVGQAPQVSASASVLPAAASPVQASGQAQKKTAPKTVAIGATKVVKAWVQKQDGTKITLGAGVNLIGREEHCTVVLTVDGVSREHAKITLDVISGNLYIEDLNSTNGTYKGKSKTEKSDATRIEQKTAIVSGDHLWIGGDKLTVVFEPMQEG